MPVKKVTSKEVTEQVESKVASKKDAKGITIPVFSLDGKETGTMNLPEEVFGVKVNRTLLAQAVRVYTTNQKDFTGSTKTRGEVSLTTAKWFRQKGTGRARHGAQSAPIFVGGGIAMGPKPRNVRLDLPKKMKKAALISALSSKVENKNILGVADLNKASGKTKQIAAFLNKLPKSKSALIVTSEKMDNVLKASRNISGVNVLPFTMLNAYEIVKHQLLVLDTETVIKIGEQEGAKK